MHISGLGILFFKLKFLKYEETKLGVGIFYKHYFYLFLNYKILCTFNEMRIAKREQLCFSRD